jgi:DNA-binding YbaB/EbfC family protein
MKNLGQMMKQAQEMQTKMAELQEKLVEMEIEGVAAAGMIRVTMNGKGQMRAIKIDPALANPDEVEVLEDLILAATNDAKAKTETRVAEEMQELTGGLQLPPGMQLPF